MDNQARVELEQAIYTIAQEHSLEVVAIEVLSKGYLYRVMLEDSTKNLTIQQSTVVMKKLLAFTYTKPSLSGIQFEVSSPGIDRLLLKVEDFVVYKGQKVKVFFNEPLQQKLKIVGSIVAINGEVVSVEYDSPEGGKKLIDFTLNQVKEAKLVLTDELIKFDKILKQAYQQKNPIIND